jgi:putative holliday junction resolvase
MRIVGIDYGTKRIGIAVSDGLLITAQPLDTIRNTGPEAVFAAINKVIIEYGASEVVVGLPLNMNGTHSQKTRETLKFAEDLSRAVAVPVVTWDERLSSAHAERVLLEADMSRQKRKMLSDKVAAVMILQNYMDRKKTREKVDDA